MAKNVQLGSLIRERITGFAGIAMGRHEYLTGCTKITIQPLGLDKDGHPQRSEWFDEPTIDVLEPPKPGVVDDDGSPGGPTEEPRRTLV